MDKYETASQSEANGDRNIAWRDCREFTSDATRASWIGDIGVLRRFVDEGGLLDKPDAKGATPLGLCCGYGHTDAVALLLSARADPEVPCAKGGELPLHRAARFGHAKCVALLLDAQASIDRPDGRGWTALHHAAGRGHAETVAVLCEHRQIDQQLLSAALSVVAQYGHCDCVRVLLMSRAVPAVDESSRSPLMIAASWGHSHIIACLLAAGVPKTQDAIEAATSRGYQRCVDLISKQDVEHQAAWPLRAVVRRTRRLSSRMAMLEVEPCDMDETLWLLASSIFTVNNATGQALDTESLLADAMLPKEVKFQKGVYIDAMVHKEEYDVASPLHIDTLLKICVETHDSWVARVSKHGCDATRFKTFADFARKMLKLQPGETVMDIAGGKGGTAKELVRNAGVRVILVDPAPHAGADCEEEVARGDVVVLQEPLDAEFVSKHKELLASADALLGLHPDEATDAVVELGLQLQLPFAVVPCCTFPKLFPNRRRKTGQGVVTCNGLVQYFLEMHNHFRSQLLSFEGANQVVYCTSFDQA